MLNEGELIGSFTLYDPLDFTVIGPDGNLVSRIEAVARRRRYCRRSPTRNAARSPS